MSFADVNGQHIYFEDTGGPGAAVIFSHGFLLDHEMFEPQVADLSDEFRCITRPLLLSLQLTDILERC